MKCNIPPLAWMPKNIIDFFWKWELFETFNSGFQRGSIWTTRHLLTNPRPPSKYPFHLKLQKKLKRSTPATIRIKCLKFRSTGTTRPLQMSNRQMQVVVNFVHIIIITFLSNAGCCQFCPHHHHHLFVKCRLLSILSTSSSSSPFCQMQVVVNFVHIIIITFLSNAGPLSILSTIIIITFLSNVVVNFVHIRHHHAPFCQMQVVVNFVHIIIIHHHLFVKCRCCQFCPHHHHHHHFVTCCCILSTSSSSPFRQMLVVVNFVHIIIIAIYCPWPQHPPQVWDIRHSCMQAWIGQLHNGYGRQPTWWHAHDDEMGRNGCRPLVETWSCAMIEAKVWNRLNMFIKKKITTWNYLVWDRNGLWTWISGRT